MSASKVQCQCCGKMMVPTVVRSRGIFVGWASGWWFGGGKPVSSCCPFCLSENWDDAFRPVEKSVSEKTILLFKVLLSVVLAYALFSFIGIDVLGLSFDGLIESVAQWTFIAIAFIIYRRNKQNKKGL